MSGETHGPATVEERPRQLLVFCDGTNNTLTGRKTDTNVLQLYEHVARTQDDRQTLYYDPGVGSPDVLPGIDAWEYVVRKWERISGLAAGRGVFENVGEAYAFLAREYRPGDQIFLFGFSRGAFTARSVAGMIHLFGIIRPESAALIPTLLRVYFAPKPSEGRTDVKYLRGGVAGQIRDSFTSAAGHDASVRFVGVWDTVATVGLPPFDLRISSKATIKGKRFEHVRHALSLDEHRALFQPRLYSDLNEGDEHAAQSLRQLWFRGVHCDVGGGYPTRASALSDDALTWMFEEATKCGLRCHEALAPKPATRLGHDPMHENALWALAGMTLRDTTQAVGTEDGDSEKVDPVAHPSAAAPPPKSVWDDGAGMGWTLAAIAAAIAAAVASGLCLLPARGPGAGVADLPHRAWEALRAGGSLAWTQTSALWHPSALSSDLSTAAARAVRHAIELDFLFIAAYGWLLARLVSRSFARLAGWRNVSDPVPHVARLGMALPFLLGCDVLENLLGLLAGSARANGAGPWLAVIGGLASCGKWLGLLGCVALVVLGLARGRRTPAS